MFIRQSEVNRNRRVSIWSHESPTSIYNNKNILLVMHCFIQSKCYYWLLHLINIAPCGESTVVSIVSCRCAYCYPEPVHGKKNLTIFTFLVMALCYVQKCELSYNVGMTQNCIPQSEIIIPNRECVIRLIIGEGANVSK